MRARNNASPRSSIRASPPGAGLLLAPITRESRDTELGRRRIRIQRNRQGLRDDDSVAAIPGRRVVTKSVVTEAGFLIMGGEPASDPDDLPADALSRRWRVVKDHGRSHHHVER